MKTWSDKEQFKARVLEWANKLGVKTRDGGPATDAQQMGILLHGRESELQRRAAGAGS